MLLDILRDRLLARQLLNGLNVSKLRFFLHIMQGLKLPPHAEICKVPDNLATGNIDVFVKLQPKLYKAFPTIQPRPELLPV